MKKNIVCGVIIVLAATTIFLLYVKEKKMEAKAGKLDIVCEHVREMLCVTRAGLDNRPGYEGFHAPPSNVEIGACTPETLNDFELGEAIKKGDETYKKELRSQVDRAIRTIPELYPNVPECRE